MGQLYGECFRMHLKALGPWLGVSDKGNGVEGKYLNLVLSFQHSSKTSILPPNQW